jgi:hypothetical protein
MISFKALSGGLAVVALAGCINSSGRPGPFVDVDAPAPLLVTRSRYPTQGQAQAAVDAAVQQRGMESVYPSFSTIAPGRVPTYVALFACKPGFHWPAVNTVGSRRGFVYCHVDVMDQSYALLGRATMSFAPDERGDWLLASDREREIDAR